ncbi:hypothetical protein SCOR_02110 [Sulfidibacter corallicola]|uniref:Uncharacterized protein n=1 Tax=Sulfidibacter corallicola TaxID=2818388 RepID=A0A8A4TGB2_SULCO|nr:hypothetical protein [Sulfidibacter corallicola]QTD48683.1 hypothetical protein J3U87_24135 [Sulfidibacter corallicola]
MSNQQQLWAVINLEGKSESGNGITSERTSSGTYLLQFGNLFLSDPAVTATAIFEHNSNLTCITKSLATTHATLQIVDRNGTPIDARFSVVVTGTPKQ